MSEKVVLFCGKECYKREFLFHCEIAIFYTSLRPLRPFLVKGTELYKC